MQLNETINLLNKFVPDNYQDIRILLAGIKYELKRTKEQLAKELVEWQKSNDYKSLHEIINLQETLENYIKIVEEISGDSTEEEISMYCDKKESNPPFATTERVDYSKYAVDDTIGYNIDENIATFKRLAAVSFINRRFKVKTWVSLYVTICSLLYKDNPSVIEGLVYKKRTGIKIAKNGVGMFRPIKISGSQLWLECHGSAETLRKSIIALLDMYHIPHDEVKVFYRRDYTDLHKKEYTNEK